MSKAKKPSFTQALKRPLIIGFILAALAGVTIWGFVASGKPQITPLSKRPANLQIKGETDSTVVRNQIQTPKEGELTLAWFSATWCTICKEMRKFTPKVMAEFPTVHLEEHDIDQDPRLAEQHRVRGMPTFVFINAQGKEILRFNGASENGFRQQIQRAVNLI